MLDLFFTKTKLMQAVNTTMKAVPNRTSLPILECLLLEAKNGIVTLMANDMEMAIRSETGGTIISEGTVALDAKLFSDIIRNLPEEEIHIKVDSNLQVEITSADAYFTMSGKNGDDFIGMPSINKGIPVVISQLTLKEIIEQTIFSISANENNKMMTGELFEIKGNTLRVAALDGHRIAIRYSVMNNQEAVNPVSVIVPGKTLNDLSRIISGDASKMVNIFIGKNHILFAFEGTTLVSRLIEGEYFRIDQMITSNYETKLVFNRRRLLNCIERSVILVRESDKKPLILNIKDGSVTLSLTSIIGSMKEEMEAEKEGSNLMIGFNPRFLIDALRAISDENVTLYLTNSRAPGFIRDEEGTYIYLILPVNFVTR